MFLFLSLSTQHLAWIVTGTGIVFTVIFYIGTKEPAVRPQRKISKPMDPVVWSNIRYRMLSPCPWTIRNLTTMFIARKSTCNLFTILFRMIGTLFHCNADLRWKSLLRIIPYKITFSPVLLWTFPAKLWRWSSYKVCLICMYQHKRELSLLIHIYFHENLIHSPPFSSADCIHLDPSVVSHYTQCCSNL